MTDTARKSKKNGEKRPKSNVVLHRSNQEISGLGEDVVKVIEEDTGATICFIGAVDDEIKVYFNRTMKLAEIEAVADLLHKKKFGKLLNKNIEKAQSYADKKFHV